MVVSHLGEGGRLYLLIYVTVTHNIVEHAVAQSVQALRYKPEGNSFNP